MSGADMKISEDATQCRWTAVDSLFLPRHLDIREPTCACVGRPRSVMRGRQMCVRESEAGSSVPTTHPENTGAIVRICQPGAIKNAICACVKHAAFSPSRQHAFRASAFTLKRSRVRPYARRVCAERARSKMTTQHRAPHARRRVTPAVSSVHAPRRAARTDQVTTVPRARLYVDSCVLLK